MTILPHRHKNHRGTRLRVNQQEARIYSIGLQALPEKDSKGIVPHFPCKSSGETQALQSDRYISRCAAWRFDESR